MASFSTYQSQLRTGLPTREDGEWVEQLLGKFMNRQTALFLRWLDISLPSKKELRKRLVVITPLRIILIKTKTFGRSVHRKYRIIDITSVQVAENKDTTDCIIRQCDFPPELSLSRSREKLKNKEFAEGAITIVLPKDIDREFLDILQWSLFIVTRGLPKKFRPKISIPKTFENEISDPVGPAQFVIDRYVAYCDAQTKNSGAGIAASESLIEYTLGSVASGVFDVNLAFNATKRNIDNLQFVCLSQGLSFNCVYKKLVLNQLSGADDTNIAILMTLLETNHEIETLEFRRVDVQQKTMRSLSSSLSCSNGLSKLQEINIIDISINKNMILALSTGLSYIKLKVLRLTNCYLNKTATIQLFNILQKSEQYKHLTHLNISKNQCGKQGTKAIAAFIVKAVALQVLVVADAQLDGNEFFNALTLKPNTGAQLCHLDTLTLLDFSGNNVGSAGAGYLAQFVKSSRCLNYCKLSRCNMGDTQLQVIFGAALSNMNGFDSNKKYDPVISSNMSSKRRPTHAEIMLCTNLLCLSLDLSDNAFGSKGADIMCKLLRQRENYTIVSLNVARNNFNVQDMKNVIYALRSMACLERLCISNNVKRGIGKKTDRDGVIGRALLYVFEQIPTLNELAITGSEQSNCYLEVGLQHFLASTQLVSNLEFLDITGNKIGDKLFTKFMNSLSKNTQLRLIRCADNKLSFEMQQSFVQLLGSHPSVIDKLPPDHPTISKSKSSKAFKEYFALKDAAKHNLRANKQQFEIDRKMLDSLPREMRLEKELRRCCGTQYGISVERIRGTVRNPDYSSRIPFILHKLKDLMEARGGFDTVGIFRIQPDAKEFPNVKQALNTNNFEFRINDINCIANAIKVWYRDLPIKVLNPISKQVIIKASSAKEVAQCIASLNEPYKSIFEWLLDLAVQVVENVTKNKMDAKNMAVVLCPNLYENDQQSADAMVVQQALLRFTEFAIRHRIEFRRKNPFKKINDMLAIAAGLTPGIADQNALENDDDEFKDEVSISIGSDEGGADIDGFGRSAFAGGSSRGFRGISKTSNDNNVKVASLKKRFEKQKDVPSPVPPPAYSENIESGRVSNVAANLGIDPRAMLPGSKAPKRKSAKQSQPAAVSPIEQNANLGRPSQGKKKKKKKSKKGKKLLLESMVDNYSDASAPAKVPPAQEEPEPERRKSHHVPMESKVLGGFVRPGLAISMAVGIAAPEGPAADKKHKHKKNKSDSSDEMIPALAHLEDGGGEAPGGDGGEDVLDYIHEEKTFKFETKPMGFQIEAENGKISVRSVRAMSAAGQYGVQAKWDIVAVNGFRDWSSMLGILESSLGPFTIIFAVPILVKSTEKSLSSTNRQHPIVPSPRTGAVASAPARAPPSHKLVAPAEDAEVPAVDIPPPYMPAAGTQEVLQKQKSMVSVSSAVSDEEMKADEYAAKKNRFNMMQRNSSAIVKDVLNEYDEDPELDKEVKTNRNVFASASSVQQKEYLRLESEIKKFQTKTAQLLETLQVIRLKGAMEAIELDNAKKLQSENIELKKELNSKVKPLKDQLKNCNKQIQTQRQLMYQYANLLRRHKIDIPELQVSLQENESSSDSDSDSDSSSSDDSSED
eukprot:1131504_1